MTDHHHQTMMSPSKRKYRQAILSDEMKEVSNRVCVDLVHVLALMYRYLETGRVSDAKRARKAQTALERNMKLWRKMSPKY